MQACDAFENEDQTRVTRLPVRALVRRASAYEACVQMLKDSTPNLLGYVIWWALLEHALEDRSKIGLGAPRQDLLSTPIIDVYRKMQCPMLKHNAMAKELFGPPDLMAIVKAIGMITHSPSEDDPQASTAFRLVKGQRIAYPCMRTRAIRDVRPAPYQPGHSTLASTLWIAIYHGECFSRLAWSLATQPWLLNYGSPHIMVNVLRGWHDRSLI